MHLPAAAVFSGTCCNIASDVLLKMEMGICYKQGTVGGDIRMSKGEENGKGGFRCPVEHYKLPSEFWESHGQKQLLVHSELERTRVVTTSVIYLTLL